MTSITATHRLRTPDEALRRSGPRGSRSLAGLTMRDFYQLFKVRVAVMVALVAGVGYLLGASENGSASAIDPVDFGAVILGVVLSCIGAATLNQVIERDSDALMRRTRGRPLPGGRLSRRSAALLGAALALFGVAWLFLIGHAAAAAICAVTVVSYAFVYTPMKRVTSLATVIGAIPGALPPAIGYAAAAGRLGPVAWLLCGILFIWQLPHFLAIAWLYREDYARAGTAVLPVIDPVGLSTHRQVLLGSMALVPLTMFPTVLGVSGTAYLVGGFVASGLMLGCSVAFVIGRGDRQAKAVFWASLLYLPLVSCLMVIDHL